jgi:chromosome segregation ATPase
MHSEELAETARLRTEIEQLTEELQDCQSRAQTQRYELRAEIKRLQVTLSQVADRLEKLAFAIPPPNEWTPVLVQLANAMRSEIAPKADQLAAEQA